MPKTRRLSDATLVRRSQQGDRRSFSALLGRYDWRLRGLAHALLLDQQEMEAALGIGYLRAWRDVVRINGKDDVAAWLYRVTYNACIDQLRRADGAPARATVGATGVAAGLATLPAAERVAVVLVDREGFSPASAARILGLTPTALTSTLDAARERLSAYLPTPAAAPSTEPPDTADGPDATDAAESAGAATADADIPGNGARANGHDSGDAVVEGGESPGADGVDPGRTAAAANGTSTNGAYSATAPAGADADADADADARPAGSETDSSETAGSEGPGSETAGNGSDGDGNEGAGDGTSGSADTSPTDGSDTSPTGGNGIGSNSGRGRRARRRAKHAAARQSTDRPDPSGGDNR